MTIWNQIVNAVYRNEWQLVERAVGSHHVQLDDANCMADVLGNIVAGRLRSGQTDCMQETITWLLRQPYLTRERFAEWVAMDALKADTPLHRRTFQQVAPFCRDSRLREIERHLAECDEARTRAVNRRKETIAQQFTRDAFALAFEVRNTPRPCQILNCNAAQSCPPLNTCTQTVTGSVMPLAANDGPLTIDDRIDAVTDDISRWGGCTVQ